MEIQELVGVENEYKPLNYWGWLENITPEEVRWQIRQMCNAGLGGYVMHARGGLEIPYMGEQWLDSVAAMIDEGKQLDMLTVIDDEDGWPSGFGGGEVTGKGEEYWLKWMQFERVPACTLKTSNLTIAVYTLNSDGGYIRVTALENINPDAVVLHIYYKCNRYYVDNLNPMVVQEFIRVSYEKYYSVFENEFGKGVGSIFSDEPQLARQFISWSGILPAEFEKRFGYDLLDVLPAVFFQVDNFEKVRYDFWSMLNSLFTESYSQQIGEWCEAHQVKFSGHTVLEEFLGLQLLGSAGTMTFYEHMQLPGIDWLGRGTVSNMLVKQVTSVSQQLGRKRVLSEMFGCAGWNVSFEELKWIGEQHYVLGINLMLQHLGLYSLKGSRKREYPASLFYQQPWWEEYRDFNDYFARLSKIMSESKPQIDLLVLHPLKSAWIAFEGQDYERIGWDNHGKIEGDIAITRNENFKEIKDLDEGFKILTADLLELNFDFHYGDETLLKKYGSVQNNKVKVGAYLYSTVIIPPSISMDRDTLNLLKTFASQGGNVISVSQFPELVEGVFNEGLEDFKRKVVFIENDKNEIKDALSAKLISPILISLCDGKVNKHVYGTTNKKDTLTYYYVVNTDLQQSYKIDIHLDQEGPVLQLDLTDGTLQALPSLIGLSLEPAQSLLLVQGCRNDVLLKPVKRTGRVLSTTEIATDIEWKIIKHDMNSITLDFCQYCIDQGDWEPEIAIIKLQKEILALGKPVDVKMRFRFFAEESIQDTLFLVLEEPEKFSILLNGDIIEPIDCGWWVDKTFKKIEITGKINKGWNNIILSRHFFCSEHVYQVLSMEGVHEAESNRLRYDTELESIYLLGNFSINTIGKARDIDRRALVLENKFTLAPMKEYVRMDNLVTEGFPFFAGKITLSKVFNLQKPEKGQRIQLQLCRPDATVSKVFINGRLVKALMWAPYCVDITDDLAEGDNEISLELINSLRNLLGPHHHTSGELYSVGPGSFNGKENWTNDYCFVRLGIEENISIQLMEEV